MPRVLIIEDEIPVSQMYLLKLQKKGYKVSCAYDGSEGLEMAEKLMPDLIILDLLMPVMSGEVMLQKMRATDWGKHIKVIVVTNVGSDLAHSRLRLLHVERYLIKVNHTPAEIADCVDEVLSKSKALA